MARSMPGAALAYSYSSRYPSNGAPTLALLLTGIVSNQAETWEMGDRTSIAPYLPNMRVVIHDTPPIVRASWLRGVSALPNSFAHESWIDEAATMAGVDPVEYRLRYLTDKRGIAVIEATAERAGWTPHTRPQTLGRGRLAARARLCLCALRPFQISRLWRRLGGLGGRCGGQCHYRRSESGESHGRP
jgi:nicotinate dehydrogenase subunit B